MEKYITRQNINNKKAQSLKDEYEIECEVSGTIVFNIKGTISTKHKEYEIVENIIKNIESGRDLYYTNDDVEIKVVIKNNGDKYIRSVADDESNNNLLNLEEYDKKYSIISTGTNFKFF
jgi:hypothetical protein